MAELTNEEFEAHYGAFYKAMETLPHDQLWAIARIFSFKYPLPEDPYGKQDCIQDIWRKIREYRTGEARLRKILDALHTLKYLGFQ